VTPGIVVRNVAEAETGSGEGTVKEDFAARGDNGGQFRGVRHLRTGHTVGRELD
jgi:hypothetical protein